jgi:AcrR family transcriptional regulator
MGALLLGLFQRSRFILFQEKHPVATETSLTDGFFYDKSEPYEFHGGFCEELRSMTEVKTGEEMGKQKAKSLRARTAICDATIDCLYERGYGETSLVRVASLAGFSKGALQYHFPSKEDLMAATADVLLSRPFERKSGRDRRPRSVEAAIISTWNRMTNTPAYRALLEILIAARTDDKLQIRISDNLHRWNKAMDEQSLATFQSVGGTDKDVVALLTMTRSLMRGLVIQDRYSENPGENDAHVKRWAKLIAPQLKFREGWPGL